MDELALSEVSEPAASSNNVFLFQQVAVLREQLLKGKKWDEIVKYQLQNIFTMTDYNDKDLKKLADLYSDDIIGDVIEPKVDINSNSNNNNNNNDYEDF